MLAETRYLRNDRRSAGPPQPSLTAAREHVRQDMADGQMRILDLTDVVARHQHADVDEVLQETA